MINELKKICDTKEEFSLLDYNTYKLSSSCLAIAFPKNLDELKKILEVVKKHKVKFLILGNGSNVIIPKYYDGIVIKLKYFNKCSISENEVYVESGYMINKLALELSSKGMAGLEWASGIPGTIGGSIYGNAGAYGSSMSDIIISCNVFDGKNILELSNEEMKFEYRNSIFKNNKKYIILSCKLKTTVDTVDNLMDLIKTRTEKRKETQDLENPSCGSVFRNPEGLVAGKLIDDLGLKGFSINGAMISNKHANFIINKGGATSDDIIKLIKKIKSEIKKNYNVDLVLEQEIIK
ncbi:MAG: UDP-N-acetylmuramate dehydrogenase [Tenericutes bacterium]|nr:UDP-N-acetylmuramate dehydrogenase [Mycoplasmatota bacterium]